MRPDIVGEVIALLLVGLIRIFSRLSMCVAMLHLAPLQSRS